VGLLRVPARPRRWAVGGYFEGVEGLSTAGEMHVRPAHYFGIAPMPGRIANACLVAPLQRGQTWGDPARVLTCALAADPQLGPRFTRARLTAPPTVLGPMALDASGAGVPGLLLAGDAAGFIDPMTGDGLRLALEGAVLAAHVAADVLAGRVTPTDAPARLLRRRSAAFSSKWRFNRALRRLVASPGAVHGATIAARLLPRVFEAMIRYAGDCGTVVTRDTMSLEASQR
jgi:menaquinone-9 beta-reductase